MADLVLLEWEGDSGATEQLSFDATVGEQHDATVTITEHALEDGTVVSDHIIVEQPTVGITAWVTNTPIVQPDFDVEGAVGAERTLQLTDRKQTTFQFDKEFDRVRNVHFRLNHLMRSGYVVKLKTKFVVYDSMLLVSVGMPRDIDSKDAVAISLTFKQVQFQATREADAVQPKINAAKPTKSLDTKGEDAGTSSDKGTENKTALKSLIDSGADALNGLSF